jgi:hypothetical protein
MLLDLYRRRHLPEEYSRKRLPGAIAGLARFFGSYNKSISFSIYSYYLVISLNGITYSLFFDVAAISRKNAAANAADVASRLGQSLALWPVLRQL